MVTKALFALLGLIYCNAGYATDSPQRPHIVVVMADDLGFNDIGYMNPEVLTPNMDELARNGVILNKNYVVNVCTPSRTAFITGRDPFKTTMQHSILSPWSPRCVPTDIPFLSSAFKEGGYQTHLSGKWHLGSCKWGCTPNDRGFDSFVGLLEGAGDYYTHETFDGFDWWKNQDVDTSSKGVYTTDLIRNRTEDIIEGYEEGDDPLFMWLTFTAPHTPFQAPDSHKALYPDVTEPRKTYLAMISSLDDAVGSIANKLKETGMWENTFFIFTSDNGGEADEVANNLPLRGGKGCLFEGGVRVPGFVASPLLATPGSVSEEMIYITDWYPTLLSMAGIQYDSESIDGVDQSEMFLAGKPSKREMIIHGIDIEWSGGYFLGNAAIRERDMKMIWGVPGLYDGYGDAVARLTHREEYLSLINKTASEYTDIPVPRPFTNFKSQQEIANEQAIAKQIGIYQLTRAEMDEGRGMVMLFNITADPEERNNLAETAPADYEDLIYEIKNKIMKLIEEKYEAPDPVAYESWRVESAPTGPLNAWTPGWCEAVVMEVDSQDVHPTEPEPNHSTRVAPYIALWLSIYAVVIVIMV